jgi:hypothetical protein
MEVYHGLDFSTPYLPPDYAIGAALTTYLLVASLDGQEKIVADPRLLPHCGGSVSHV